MKRRSFFTSAVALLATPFTAGHCLGKSLPLKPPETYKISPFSKGDIFIQDFNDGAMQVWRRPMPDGDDIIIVRIDTESIRRARIEWEEKHGSDPGPRRFIAMSLSELKAG